MSRVRKPNDKFANTAHYDNSVYEPSKMVRIHCDGDDYHKSTTFSSWLFVKYNTSYKTYRNKSKKRREELSLRPIQVSLWTRRMSGKSLAINLLRTHHNNLRK